MKSAAFIRACILGVALLAAPAESREPRVHMANGIKVGEVSATSALVWTRLTRHSERNVRGKPFPARVTQRPGERPFGDLREMKDSVPGAAGDVRIIYWPSGSDSQRSSTKWLEVDPGGDFTRTVRLAGLRPGSRYEVVAEGRPRGGTRPCCRVKGGFRTAPKAETPARVTFTVVTGQSYDTRDSKKGHRIYPVMRRLRPDFFVHTGDIVYYDQPGPYADSLELARFKWNRIFAMPYQRAFHNTTASYFMKDDHDTVKNDCWPGKRFGELTWEQGISVFREQVPMGSKTFRTVRWGKDLQLWLVEGRDFRDPNYLPDGPQKTLWGAKQKRWFFNTVRASDATFRILISPTPLVGPDRSNKFDNHANISFAHEGNALRSFIGEQKNMSVICGDRHWQYVSVDSKTGVREYGCGPASDRHAGGYDEDWISPSPLWVRVKGGFLHVTVERDADRARLVLRHHGVDGTVHREEVVRAE